MASYTALDGKTRTADCTHCDGTGDCGCEISGDEFGFFCEECHGAGWIIL